MEVAAARTMPERGQMALDGFITQKAPQPVQQALPEAAVLQQACQRAEPGGSLDKPTAMQQAGLRRFLPAIAGQQGLENEGGAALHGGSSGGRKRPWEDS